MQKNLKSISQTGKAEEWEQVCYEDQVLSTPVLNASRSKRF
jgi:hypothetical protein